MKASGKHGFVLIYVAVALTSLLGLAGLAIDIGRMYLAKSETQEFCDAAALGAAVKLDGKMDGITAAQSAVTASFGQPWTLGPYQIGTPQVDFATGSEGPWSASPGSAAGYTYARVRASTTVRLYLLPVLINQNYSTVAASAVAAQVPQTTFNQGLVPYTAVTVNPSDPNLGFTVNQEYSIRWPNFNGSRSGCNASNPDRCFNQPPCSGDSAEARTAIVDYWSSNTSGYWGSTSNSSIAQEILDVIQLQPVTLGQLIPMTAGNKNSEGGILNQRVNQDLDVLDNSVSAYLQNPNRNGRRLIATPVVQPGTSGTVVAGFASFLLESNGSPSTFYKGSGNDPYCALYVGPYVQGSNSTGGTASAGAFKVLLVQ